MDLIQQFCPYCHNAILENYYFCPNCGKSLKPSSTSTSIAKQISIYALSIFLPPLGLWPGIKYLKQDNDKAKLIGLIAIILTIISGAITIWIAIGYINQINQVLGGQTFGL